MMVNCCPGMRNVTDGVLGAAGGPGNIVGKEIFAYVSAM